MSMNNLEMEVLLEVALSIGGSLNLEFMLSGFLARTTRLMNRSAVLVIEAESGVTPTTESSKVHAIPKNLGRSSELHELLRQLDWSRLALANAHLDASVSLAGNAMSCQVFTLPGHGYLVLLGERVNWSLSFLDGVRLVCDKLAMAMSACQLNSRLEERSRQLELATRAANIGFWEWHLDSDRLVWNKQMCRLFEIDYEHSSGLPSDFFARVHPEDIDELRARIANFVDYGGADSTELHFRICCDDGAIKKLICFGVHHVNADGSRSMVGVNYDASRLERSATQTLYRSELEQLLLALSMKVILAPPERLDEITSEALRDVGRFVGADRAYRFDYDFEAGHCDNTHEWCAEGISPEIDNLQAVPFDAIPLWVSSHQRGLPLYITRVQDLPVDHGVRKILEPQGVQSLVTIPLMDEGDCLGFIGFDAVREERHWTDVDIAVLKVLAQLLVNAQVKSRNETRLQSVALALRRSRDAARRLALAAEQANKAKSRFVATVSHEIRTPLHAVLGLADVLAEQSLPETAQELVCSIRDAGAVLLELINDVLDFSHIESDSMEIQAVAFDLRALINGLRALFESAAHTRGLALVFKTAPGLPKRFIGDPMRIRQVLNNLMSNAVKFADQGQITVTVDAGGKQSCAECLTQGLVFRVRDTGVGISEENQRRLFEAFFQVDASDSRSYAGSGLGLTIAHMLVVRMGGEMGVSSALGEGSEFFVSLPLLKAEESGVSGATHDAGRSPLMPVAGLKGKRILLAEDNPVNRRLVAFYLQDEGCELVLAENGELAVKCFAEQDFDLVLMDCQMPVLDGFDATAAIRRTGEAGNRVPIVAVTASGGGADVSRCLQLGMNDVLVKPFTRAQLLDAIWQRCGNAAH